MPFMPLIMVVSDNIEGTPFYEKRCLSMEEIKKWTCEYIERELDDIHVI